MMEKKKMKTLQETSKRFSPRYKNKTTSTAASRCIVCPVCTLSVRGEHAFKIHYQEELERMKNPFNSIDLKKRNYCRMRSRTHSSEQWNNDDNSNSVESCVEEVKKIKKRKYSRYAEMFLLSTNRSKSHTFEANAQYDLFSCAVCNKFLESSDNRSTIHLAKCFAKKEFEYDLYSSGSDDEDVVEEFSWAGQTWIRTSSLLEPALLQREGRLTRLEMEDGDEELDVDGDQTTCFGMEQFSEADVIPCTSSDTSQKRLREVLSTCVTSNKGSSNSNERNSLDSCLLEEVETFDDVPAIDVLEQGCDGDREKFIGVLKERMKKIERKFETETSKCPICMGPYSEPLVSTSCWHVCCTECWMRTLGAKKLCPKCNNIVSPSQLRKIFL